LYLVHSGSCGPVDTSLGGCKYFALFIDDFSHVTWVHVLKDKLETFEN
jgi:hypothetical protein